jgi:hypothetical protein
MSDSPLPESLSNLHAIVFAHVEAGVRSGYGQDAREARLQTPSRPPLQPQPAFTQLTSSHLAYPTSTKAN